MVPFLAQPVYSRQRALKKVQAQFGAHSAYSITHFDSALTSGPLT